ncbi:hypothetical protein C8J57DRAFT_1461262 [Mycena rebaudengoi]|nr:hypothetical protein C8J57DRAFT_1461262 [Mycena rebaudengoi]
MDQDSFRLLLQSSASGSGAKPQKQQKSRGSLFAPASAASTSGRKTIDASEPAFKPRKVKKSDAKYRDRAAERRVGEGNDYAQVEAVLEDFEKRFRGQKRAITPVLVRGLDVALLEQNKAKASLSTVDDDSLEQAFMEAATEPAVPKKRTREDMIRELKEKRGVKSSTPASKPTDDALEAAKKQGKFKPIGFKPIGAAADEKAKKKKAKSDGTGGERKKKKRKLEAEDSTVLMPPPPPPSKVADPTPSVASSSSTAIPPEDDTPEDFDIFADAGEYQGIDLGDDDDDDDDEDKPPGKSNDPQLEEGEELSGPGSGPVAPGKWFEQDDSDSLLPSAPKLPLPISVPEPPSRPSDEDEEGEVHPTRLVPLQSSALPSIKDLLAMDKAANSSEKWKKRKDKKKSGKEPGDEAASKKMNAEVKAERDYKRFVFTPVSACFLTNSSLARLKSYTDKKGAAPAE